MSKSLEFKLAEQNHLILQLISKVSDLELKCLQLVNESKVDRSDKLMTAKEIKKSKFVTPIGDDKLHDMVARGLPQIIPKEGAHPLYSDKLTDEWIAKIATSN